MAKKLSANALKVLERRYLLKDEAGKVKESPEEMFYRVSDFVASGDEKFGKSSAQSKLEFFQIMSELLFLPNSPTLMNAGTLMKQLSACFVIPVKDSIEGIFDGLKDMALIHQSGGGTGFSFSELRPKNDVVRSTGGVASGPVSFMRIYDEATEVVKQGGRRRGANMGILRVDHPDILEFITAKKDPEFLTNFNISVAVTDQFMQAVLENKNFSLVSPRTGKKTGELSALKVFDLMAESAWESGDPGLIFIDQINRHNPTPQLGEIQATNPCGEQPLLPFESCNLGSINLSLLAENGKLDWQKLETIVKLAIHFLDNVIELNHFPLKEIEQMSALTRKVGLGVMGFADLLIKLGIVYPSEAALKMGEQIISFIREKALQKSVELAKERGAFPAFAGSRWEKQGFPPLRNSTLTTIAPTGSISIIAGTSSGIEPIFAVSFIREILNGTQLLEVNPVFLEIARREGFYSEALMLEIARTGGIQEIKTIPAKYHELFLTAQDIAPDWHIKMQAAFQKFTDNGVSKTINLPESATAEQVKVLYLTAYREKLKGITIYRYASKPRQVLYRGKLSPEQAEEYLKAPAEHTGECRVCTF